MSLRIRRSGAVEVDMIGGHPGLITMGNKIADLQFVADATDASIPIEPGYP